MDGIVVALSGMCILTGSWAPVTHWKITGNMLCYHIYIKLFLNEQNNLSVNLLYLRFLGNLFAVNIFCILLVVEWILISLSTYRG